MFKSAIFIINTILLILFNIAASDVTVTHTTPKRVEEGNSFVVNVSIKKGKTNGYAKYQVILPAGVTAENVANHNAKFTVDGNKVKFVWVSLPEESSLNVSYKVVINDESIKEVAIGGTFAYLLDNERQTVDAPINRIAIGKKVSTVVAAKEPIVQVNRVISPMSENKYKVSVHIKAQHVKGFAKIQDVIPSGAKATIDNPEEAVFTPVASKVKFVWMNFPEDKTDITVSYFLEYQNDLTPEITGEFAYLFDGKTINAPIQLEASALAFVPDEAPTNTETPSPNETKPTPEPSKEEAKKQTVTQPVAKPKPQPKRKPQTTYSQGQVTPMPITPKEENGIVYKVQIMAGHNSVNTSTYFVKKYNFKRKVGTYLHDGWHKYHTGSLTTYKGARDLRNDIRSNFNFRGPFVVAYNNGERITVQEALMATSQKWVP